MSVFFPWSMGMQSVKVVPFPSSDSTSMRPLWRSMMSLVMESPTPRPPEARSRLASERQNLENTRAMSSLAMPIPVSVTAIKALGLSCLTLSTT